MSLNLDVLIFGGGAAGLWLLDDLRRRGFAVLLVENCALGAGQTVTSQGIIHGGIKYSLGGLISDSTKAIREMPALWRDCLAGRRKPELSRTPVLSEHCFLWRTSTIKSKLGMVGAKMGLRSQVARAAAAQRPTALARCPGEVLQVDEQVIDTVGFLRNMADRNSDLLIKIDERDGAEFQCTRSGRIETVRLRNAEASFDAEVRADCVVLCAGAGNAFLRERIGLSLNAMQRRPLHMVLLRGALPSLFGHCADGAATRVTITSVFDGQDRTVWQVGGKVAEDGVGMESAALIKHARAELRAVLPGCRFDDVEWSSYTVDRAEPKTADRTRPNEPHAVREGNVITAWPTKLALVPRLAKLIVENLLATPSAGRSALSIDQAWPRPDVALPPWEADRSWSVLQST